MPARPLFASRMRFASMMLGAFVFVFAGPAARAADLLVPGQYPTIQAAIDSAVNGDRVLVDAGTYTGPGNTNVSFKGKNITVTGPDNGWYECIIDCEYQSRAFQFVGGENNAHLIGFTVLHAKPADGGAAIDVVTTSDSVPGPTLWDCYIADNEADGIAVHGGTQQVQVWTGWITRNQGSGIVAYDHGNVNVNSTGIDANTVAGVLGDSTASWVQVDLSGVWGSPIGVHSGTDGEYSSTEFSGNSVGAELWYAHVDWCTFSGNSVGLRGLWDGYQVVNYTDIQNNTLGVEARSLYATGCNFSGNGTAMRVIEVANTAFADLCSFTDNGVGVELTNNTQLISQGSTFLHNGTALIGSGEVYPFFFDTRIVGSTGWAVDVSDFEGGFVMAGSLVHDNGAGVRITAKDPPPGASPYVAVAASDIVYNPGAGFSVTGAGSPQWELEVTDSIFWGNGAPDLIGVTATYSDVGTGDTAGEGNISSDPLFVRLPSPGPDLVWGPTGSNWGNDDDLGDLTLQLTSPCINAGAVPGGWWGWSGFWPAVDKAGNPRVVGGKPDMGAYESSVVLPVANAGSDQTVAVYHDGNPATNTAPFTLDGSKSTGGGLSYLWLEGATVVGAGSTVGLSRPAGTYTFTLQVTDSRDATATDDVQIVVQPEPNGAPSANAGPDQLFHSYSGVNVRLNGSGSDPDNDAITFVWSEGGVTIGTGPDPSPYFAPGTHTVTLTVTDTYGAAATDNMVVQITPDVVTFQLTSLSKTSTYAGEFPPTITATGAGFKKGAVLTWNGTPMPTTYISPTQLRTKLTADQVAVAGIFQIGVVNPDSSASNTLTFTVKNRAPYLTALNPASVTHGSPTFTLQVIGERFLPGTVFLWKGQPRPTVYVSPTLLLATVYDTDVVKAGSATVRVNSPGPGGGNSNARTFYILP